MKGDFFSRLAERTLGVAPVVKPDLMPVFAATPDNTAVSDSVPGLEETHAYTSTPNRVPPQQHAGSPVQVFDAAHTSNRNADTPQSSTRSWQLPPEFPRRHDAPLDREIESANQFPESAEVSQSLHTREVVEIEGRHAQREIATRKSISLTEITDRIYTAPATVPSESSRTINAPAPAIQISIGRVEVRAVVPTALAPRAVERKAAPRLSLEQYLRERNERRR